MHISNSTAGWRVRILANARQIQFALQSVRATSPGRYGEPVESSISGCREDVVVEPRGGKMRDFANASWSGRLLLLAIVAVTGMPLFAQQPQNGKDVFSFKTIPVKFDKDYGAAIARIGEGRLVQMDATIVEIPPGGK